MNHHPALFLYGTITQAFLSEAVPVLMVLSGSQLKKTDSVQMAAILEL